MSTADSVTIAVGIGGLIATIFLGLQNNRIAAAQNEIFREQNRIFAAQAGIKMPETGSRKNSLGMYWPALAALAVAIAVGLIVARLQMATPKPFGVVVVAMPWVLLLILAFWITVARKRPENPAPDVPQNASLKEQLKSGPEPKPSKLKIHWATYRAMNGQAETYDVTECLQKMVCGDGLVLQIENHNFVVDGRNYVPKDPLPGKKKQLEVGYSFNEVSASVYYGQKGRAVSCCRKMLGCGVYWPPPPRAKRKRSAKSTVSPPRNQPTPSPLIRSERKLSLSLVN